MTTHDEYKTPYEGGCGCGICTDGRQAEIAALRAALAAKTEELIRVKSECAEEIEAAADNADAAETRWNNCAKECAAWAEAKRSAEAERDRLKKIIEDAPHTDECHAAQPCDIPANPPGFCTGCDCWKAKALAEPTAKPQRAAPEGQK